MGSYRWARSGDVNAFFGLMLDNVAVLVILFTSIVHTGLFTADFVLTHMVPGTALGVLFGDLVYTWMAFRLARRTGNTEVTAMPLGLDTPSTFGMAFFILIPALGDGLKQGLSHDDAMLYAWRIAVVVLIFIGIFKVVCAPLGNAVRRWVPQAGLLGSLAAIALALIAFLPLVLDGIAAVPLVGMISLMIILITLIAHRMLPGRIPGALAAVAIGVGIYWLSVGVHKLTGVVLVPSEEPLQTSAWQPPALLSALFDAGIQWKEIILPSLKYLPIAVPFALATIVGGIDCTESAAAAGDEYDTRTILLTEGATSLLAACFGGVIQTTPYIGHPAYKAMGGRAAYCLATALFIGAAGYFGWFTHLFELLPRAAMFPILVYVGIEITAASFRATPTRHYPALAVAMLPALAALANVMMANASNPATDLPKQAVGVTITCLASGFIVTSLLWAAAVAALIDGKFRGAAVYLAIAAVFALFGIIHSPKPGSPIEMPWDVFAWLTETYRSKEGVADPRALCQSPYHWAGAYALCAAMVFGLTYFKSDSPVEAHAKVAE